MAGWRRTRDMKCSVESATLGKLVDSAYFACRFVWGRVRKPSDGSHGCRRCGHRFGGKAARGPFVDTRRSEGTETLRSCHPKTK